MVGKLNLASIGLTVAVGGSLLYLGSTTNESGGCLARSHTVQPEDTLEDLASAWEYAPDAILDHNNMTTLQVGATVCEPSLEHYPAVVGPTEGISISSGVRAVLEVFDVPAAEEKEEKEQDIHTEAKKERSQTTLKNAPAQYQPMFVESGKRHKVDPNLLASIAKAESAYNPKAVSHAGAQGLMQFMPETAAGMGIDPWDEAQAIDGAARYIHAQYAKFGSIELALAAYNAGPNAVKKYGGIPPYKETQNYVKRVMKYYRA